jgi:fructose-specific phosphotransferase system IIC component
MNITKIVLFIENIATFVINVVMLFMNGKPFTTNVKAMLQSSRYAIANND